LSPRWFITIIERRNNHGWPETMRQCIPQRSGSALPALSLPPLENGHPQKHRARFARFVDHVMNRTSRDCDCWSSASSPAMIARSKKIV
jgi:hypothetical protein